MKNFHKKLGVFSASLLLALVAAYIYSPIIKSHADSSDGVDVSLTIDDVISLSLNKSELELSANTHSFVDGSVEASVVTNSQYGYTLTLEDTDNSSDMTHTNSLIRDVISSDFDGAKTSGSLSDNTWGFTLDHTSFYKVPVFGEPTALKRTNSPMITPNETTTVGFWAKIGNTPSGIYGDDVLFTAYVNGQDGFPKDSSANPTDPGFVKDIFAISTMQDMNSVVCSKTTTPSYSAQGSDYDGSHRGDENYVPRSTLRDARDNTEYTIAKLADGNCWMTSNLKIANATLTSADSNLEEGETWTLPASSNAPEGFLVYDANWNSTNYNQNAVYVDPTYGGYYTFQAATAGWGTTDVRYGSAPHDICPKGWMLPTMLDGWDSLTGAYAGANSVRNASLLSFNGEFYSGAVSYQGDYGYYWSSTSSNYQRAYYTYMDSGSILTYYDAEKGFGMGVRCVAK